MKTQQVIETLDTTARELQEQNIESPNEVAAISSVIFTVGLCLAKILQNIERKLDDANNDANKESK